MYISLAPEQLFIVGPINVTNSMLSFFLILISILLIAYIGGKKISAFKPGKFQLFFETLFEYFHDTTKEVLGKEFGSKYFAFVFSFFILIIISNWFGLLPFVPSIGFVEHENVANVEKTAHTENQTLAETGDSNESVEAENLSIGKCLITSSCVLDLKTRKLEKADLKHVFRSPSADLSFTFAMALVSVFMTNLFLFREWRLKGLVTRYFHSISPIDLFIGFLELLSETGKIISFAFRLFGNIFAGEVVLTVMTSLTLGLATFPFLGLEIFVGFIQSFVFTMLTLVFLGIALIPDEH